MTPERWRQIEQLYHAALECDGSEREAYLAEACASDEALRRYRQAIMLLQQHPPKRTRLPRGLVLNPRLTTLAEIEAENDFLVRHVEQQVRGIAQIMRGRSEAA